MSNVFKNYENQKYRKKELIIILNQDDMDIEEWKTEARKYNNVYVYQVPERYNLGKCLNFGIQAANYDIVAKFDDDNYYGRYYLTEAMDALKKNRRVSVVGKHTSFIYFEEKEALMIFRKGGEDQYQRKIKGGSFVFRKSVWDDVKFNEVEQQRIDVDFLERCKKKRYKIYSVSKYNYVCVRRADTDSHTQKISTEAYMAKCVPVARTTNFIPHIMKRF
jgi:glycosyltransferase involved in cell wall biosynthesis